MDLKQYVNDAIRTESTIPVINTDSIDLLRIMEVYVAAGNMLDAIKKNIFYNKEINPEQWDSNLNTVASINVFESKHFNLKDSNRLNLDPRLFHAIIGIATESTELVEAIITAIQTGNDIDHVNVREEMFDLMWYILIGHDALNQDMEKTLEMGFEKLRRRYPEKFTQECANNRNIEEERQILESYHSK